MFVIWRSFATPKTELLWSINLLLCTSSDVLAVVQITREKTERTLYERCVEHAWSDENSIAKNYLDYWVEVRYLINTSSLGPAWFSDDNNIGSNDNRYSSINLIIDKMIKYQACLFFEEAIKINETKAALYTGWKASMKLQLL